MQVTACPRCHEPVRLPQVASDAEVRCPWCGDCYTLEEALRKLPPLLEVVAGGSVPSGEASLSGYPGHVDFGGAESFELRVEEHPLGSVAASSREKIAFQPLATDLATRQQMRKRRNQGSPVWGMLKVILGGMAGCVTALVILQAMGRLPDLGFWPFQGPGTRIWGANERPFRGGGFRRPPRLQDAPADDLMGQGASGVRAGEGDSLDMPSFPLTEPNESAAGESPLEIRWKKYLSDLAAADEANQSETAVKVAAAGELVDLLSSVEDGVSKDAMDTFVSGLAKDVPLMKQMNAIAKQRLEAIAEGSPPTSVVLFAILDRTESGWQVKRSANDESPIALKWQDASGIESGRSVLVLGDYTASEGGREITVKYLGALSEERKRSY